LETQLHFMSPTNTTGSATSGASCATGLTRCNLLSVIWHAANPLAAHHLLGLNTWSEAINLIVGLFSEEGASPPTEGSRLTGPLSLFERLMVAKMRMHRAFTIETLSYSWDRSKSSISAYLKECIPLWGEAGEDLSILDLTPTYLESLRSRSYSDQDMLLVCALPDGKDFRIDEQRSNTVLSRAARSYKVKHAAARCITWSTPSGLTFEHTNLFFARVSEKMLVKLWGPRMQKSPRNFAVLDHA
jgi:hypothetical protein